MSLAVTTATTPGTFIASLVSMPLTFAWPYGLRTTVRWSMPGKEMSSTYCEAPVIRRGSSRRLTGWPIILGVLIGLAIEESSHG